MYMYYSIQPAGKLRTRDLPDWLIAHGRCAFTTEDAATLLGIPADHVRQRLASLRASGAVVSAGRGVWLAVPAERREWGAPEPMAYIDELMGCLGADYMVGWLSAAAFHGASHQAPQAFQIATSCHVSGRTIGRTRLEAYERVYVGKAPASLLAVPAGTAVVADVATTMLMLSADLLAAGGLDNAATAIAELAWENQGWEPGLQSAAACFPASARRRCGWMLERFAGGACDSQALDGLAATCGAPTTPSLLDSHGAKSGSVDARWMLCLNREVEPDI